MSLPHRAGVVTGATLVSGRFAAWLLQNLHPRVRQRPPDDEIDGTLLNLTVLALGYRNGRTREAERLQPLPERALTTADVAAMHRVHVASVRRSIGRGQLAAERGRHGWEITPAAAREWRPRKAREARRAA